MLAGGQLSRPGTTAELWNRRSGLRLETNREHLGIEYGGEVLSPSPIAKRLGDSLSSEDFTTVSTPMSSSVSDMGLETAPAHLPMAAPPKMQDWTTVLTPSKCLVAGEVCSNSFGCAK